MKIFKHRHVTGLLALALALPLTFAATAAAATKPPLGGTANFAILAGSAITNVPTSVISGDVGLSPAAGSFITGLTCAEVSGTIYAVDATGLPCFVNNPGLLTTAKNDLVTAFDDAAGQTQTGDITGVNLAGQTLGPGVYNSTGAILISGPTPLTLDGNGNADSVFILRAAAASDLTVAATSRVVLTNSAQPCNVFWKVQSAFLQNTGFTFVGTIFALTQITATANITVQGRLLARNADVTLIQDTITRPSTCVQQATLNAASTAAAQAAAAAAAAAAAEKAADDAADAARDAAAAAATAETARVAAAAAAAAAAAEAARVEAEKAAAAKVVAEAAAAAAAVAAKAAEAAKVAKAVQTAKVAAAKAKAARAAAVKAAVKAKVALAKTKKAVAAGASTSVAGPALPPVNPAGFTG